MDLDHALALLAKQPDCCMDIAELALLLARDEYPMLDVEACLGEIQAMAHEAQGYVRGSLEARVHGLCRYLFHEMGFHGNSQDYYDPRNSYLNEVLDRRAGSDRTEVPRLDPARTVRKIGPRGVRHRDRPSVVDPPRADRRRAPRRDHPLHR